MNKEQVLGFLRHVFTFLGGIAVAKGWIDETNAVAIGGAAVTVAGFLWSMFFAPEKKLPAA